MKLHMHADGQMSEWTTEWEHRHNRACPHNDTFDVRLGYDGDLIYICRQCRRRVRVNEKLLKRILRNHLKKQQEAERAEQE